MQSNKIRDSAPLFCSGETPPGVLSPALMTPVLEGHSTVGSSPKEGQNLDQRFRMKW